MPGPGTMRGVQVVKDRWLDASSSAACLALASEPQPAVPLPAPPLAGASGPYQELMRGSALRTRSIGLPTATAWRGAFVSASAEVHCAFGFAALAEAVAGMVLLQSDWPRCQRLMSYCILAARLGGILRFSVVITVPAPACLKSMM
jgi:hypothetical protein